VLWFFNRVHPEELVVLAHVPVAAAVRRAALALRETAVLLLKAAQHRSRALSSRQLAHHLASNSSRSSRSNSSNSSRHRHNRRRPSNIDDLHLTTRTDAKNAYPFYSTSGFVVALTFPLVERPSLSRPASLFAGRVRLFREGRVPSGNARCMDRADGKTRDNILGVNSTYVARHLTTDTRAPRILRVNLSSELQFSMLLYAEESIQSV